MANRIWKPEEVEELKKAWLARLPAMTATEFCAEYSSVFDRTSAAIFQKLKMLPEYTIPVSGFTKWEDAVKLEGDFLVMMDLHIPFHHAEFIQKCIQTAKKFGVTKAILGGDVLDFHSFASFPPDFEEEKKQFIDGATFEGLLKFGETLPDDKQAELEDLIGNAARREGDLSEEIRESRKVLKALEDQFEYIFWMMGNHEKRTTALLKKVLDVQSVGRLFGATSNRWEMSHYYWVRFESGGALWQVEHPINSGKGSSKRLASKFLCNTIMGHNHQFNITTDPSGKFYAIEPGACIDESRAGYINQRHMVADTHMLGAVLVRNGLPTPLNKFTDFGMLIGDTIDKTEKENPP